MRNFNRRWRIPIALSLLLNLIALTSAARWFGDPTQQAVQKLVIFRLHLVLPPIPIAVIPQAVVKTVPQKHPGELKINKQIARAGGARPGRALRRDRVQMAYEPPTTNPQAEPSPQSQAMRDPFAPSTTSPTPVKIAPNPKANLALPAISNPQPQRGAPVTAPQLTSSTLPSHPSSENPTPLESANVPEPPIEALNHQDTSPDNSGAGPPGNNGSGSGAGAGPGNGGILPFGMGQGHGGDDGQHRIVYILDISPSMTSRIDRAKQELRACLMGLSSDDLFDIIAFGGETIPFEPYLEPATPDDRHDAFNFLDELHLIPSTNLEDAITEALNIEHVNEIVVLTDGVPTSGETNFRILAREMKFRNIRHIPIDTFGLVGKNPDGSDSSFDATNLLKQLAADSGGEFKLVPLGVASDD